MTHFQNHAHQASTEGTKAISSSEASPLPRVRICEEKAGVFLNFEGDEPAYGFARIMRALGSAEPDFVKGLLNQIVLAGRLGKTLGGYDQGALDFTIATIRGIKPVDQLEAMLATQLSCVHSAFMNFSWRLNNAETLEERESAERSMNRFARTFGMQMETLKRWRTGGEQKVTVQHVLVDQAGQAANAMESARAGIEGRVANSSTALTDARAESMGIIEDSRRTAPVVAKKKTKNDSQT